MKPVTNYFSCYAHLKFYTCPDPPSEKKHDNFAFFKNQKHQFNNPMPHHFFVKMTYSCISQNFYEIFVTYRNNISISRGLLIHYYVYDVPFCVGKSLYLLYVTAQLLFLFVLFYKSNRDILCANIIIIRKIILGKIYDVKLFHYLKILQCHLLLSFYYILH